MWPMVGGAPDWARPPHRRLPSPLDMEHRIRVLPQYALAHSRRAFTIVQTDHNLVPAAAQIQIDAGNVLPGERFELF